MAAIPLKKGLPVRSNRGYRFVLTPLADAMFQLLIFFMLSSNLAPYSLLTLRSGTAGDAGGGAGSDPAPDMPPPTEAAIWTLGAEQIVIGGQTYPRSALPALSAGLRDAGSGSVVLILDQTALVQDLSSVLEALTTAGVTSVQIASDGGA